MTTPLCRTHNHAGMAERVDRFSWDESGTQGAAARRGIPRAAVDLSLLGSGAEDDIGATAGETLGGTIPESCVNLPRDPRTQTGPVQTPFIDSSPGTQVTVVGVASSTTGAHALQVLSQGEQTGTRCHAESLGQMLSRALSTPGAAERPLNAVVAVARLTPFIRLWIGLMTAGVVGRTRGIPAHGIPSLDAVARRALDELGAQGRQTRSVVLVATDARGREVYTTLFHANGPDDITHLAEIIVCSPVQVVQRLAEQAPGPGGGNGGIDVVTGSGASLYPKLANMASCQKTLVPVSGDVLTRVRIALACLEHGEEPNIQPLYLRHADVQIPVGRKYVR